MIPEKYLRVVFDQYRMRIGRLFRSLAEGDKIRYLQEKLRIRLRVLLGRTSTLPPNLQRLRDSIEDAADEYQPGTYEGSAVLFRASEQPPEYALDRTLGWAELVLEGVDVQEVPGFHGEIVQEPQAAILAEQVRERLDQAFLRQAREAGQGPTSRGEASTESR